MTTLEFENLQNQLSIARKEISNLRQQIKSLSHRHNSDIKNIVSVLKNFQCPNCVRESPVAEKKPKSEEIIDEITFKPIGYIKTIFDEKKGIPRQSALSSLKSKIELNSSIFTNPEHALEALEDFSHIWIIYHFHRNQTHSKAKISPPRLGGQKVGVFSSRSPHRPCPIGLSLVQLDKIENSTIYFSGTDMVNDTPVLDIKPYIPHYDSPMPLENADNNSEISFIGSREAGDGEETVDESLLGGVASNSQSNVLASPTVKVPQWVLKKSQMIVNFSETALIQIQQLGVHQDSISDILRTDPRSVYLRTKYGSQIYNFQFGENNVMCKFDDKNFVVNVLQVRKKVSLEDES